MNAGSLIGTVFTQNWPKASCREIQSSTQNLKVYSFTITLPNSPRDFQENTRRKCTRDIHWHRTGKLQICCRFFFKENIWYQPTVPVMHLEQADRTSFSSPFSFLMTRRASNMVPVLAAAAGRIRKSEPAAAAVWPLEPDEPWHRRVPNDQTRGTRG